MPENILDVQLQKEFNRWAEEGRGEEMKDLYLPNTFSLSSRRGITGRLGFRARA